MDPGAPSVTARGTRFTVQPVAVRPAAAPTAASPLARTDPTLLGLRSPRPIPVILKLDAAALAAYDGGVGGLAATSPAVTGHPLRLRRRHERAYLRYLARRQSSVVRALLDLAPTARIGKRLRIVYDGVAAVVPGDRIAAIAALPGVEAVQRDGLRHELSDPVTTIVGAPTAWDALRGRSNAGAGVVVAVIDSGIWPEHPALADPGNLPAPPPTRSGAARACNFGPDPRTPDAAPFACNGKVIGGDVFLARYADTLGLGGERYPATARDGDGHGTHTATVAAGDAVEHAVVGGIDRGPASGVAPGASILAYKALSRGFGYDSDLAAAVERAVADGADVIAYAVSGGRETPATDPVALAFLDAYQAGVLVATAAGNGGPAAGTVDHVAPWVVTAAATSGPSEYRATITLADGGDLLELSGASIGGGVADPYPDPVVAADQSAGYDGGAGCLTAAAAGQFAGSIVVCQRDDHPRLAKSANVAAGGAVAMVLVGGSDVTADTHTVPTVHLDDAAGAQLATFLSTHPEATATIGAGAAVATTADVVAPFSGRGGPGLGWLKPNLAAPGVAVLGGTTPTPDVASGAVPDELYAVTNGTSDAAAAVAGAAALVRAAHAGWSPGQVASALETTAAPGAGGETPWAIGSGRIDVATALAPGLTFAETADGFRQAGSSAVRGLALDLPAIVVPPMAGVVTTTRTAVNVSGGTARFTAEAAGGSGWTATVEPSTFTLAPGASIELTIRVDASAAPDGVASGTIVLHGTFPGVAPSGDDDGDDDAHERGEHGDRDHDHGDGWKGFWSERHRRPRHRPHDPPEVSRDVRLPVVLTRASSGLGIVSSCAPQAAAPGASGTCTITVSNPGRLAGSVDLQTTLAGPASVTGADGATVLDPATVALHADLPTGLPSAPTIAPADPVVDPGYVDLGLETLGVPAIPLGDDVAIEPAGIEPFLFAGRTWDRLAITSNGTIIAGGITSPSDLSPIARPFPDAARPNAVLAPFWTDLDGTGSPGVRVATLTSGTLRYLVVQWEMLVKGTDSPRTFETWIGLNGSEEIYFTYDGTRLPSIQALAGPVVIGAENADGSAGESLPVGQAPTESLAVVSLPGHDAPDLSYSFGWTASAPGAVEVVTTLHLAGTLGDVVDHRQITITAPPAGTAP